MTFLTEASASLGAGPLACASQLVGLVSAMSAMCYLLPEQSYLAFYELHFKHAFRRHAYMMVCANLDHKSMVEGSSEDVGRSKIREMRSHTDLVLSLRNSPSNHLICL